MLFALLLAAQTAPDAKVAQDPQSAAIDLPQLPIPDFKDGPVNYPPHAFRANRQGTAFYRVTINTDGEPTSCIITQSSGTREIDQATCDFVLKRAHFKPALDAQGRPVEAIYSNKMIWSIPRW